MPNSLTNLLDRHPVISRHQHRDRGHLLDRAHRRGEIRRILPGVYARNEELTWKHLVSAVSLWDPNAVIIGEAAAALTFWPDLVPAEVHVVSRRRPRCIDPRIRLFDRSIPSEMVRQRRGVRHIRGELAAVSLVSELGTDVLDVALRSRRVTLDQLWYAFELSPHRRGNVERLHALIDSRAEPWSALERVAHRQLHAAGIGHWIANAPIVCDGEQYYQDIAMLRCPVTIELDGWEFHHSPQQFEDDRHRGNLFRLAGRTVYRFTWAMVHNGDYFVDTVQRAIEIAR